MVCLGEKAHPEHQTLNAALGLRCAQGANPTRTSSRQSCMQLLRGPAWTLIKLTRP
jgi:hypothetical protein